MQLTPTTEKERHLGEARNWLRLARERSVSKNAENEVSYLRENLLKAGATLGDIGTSEEELSRLLVAGHLVEARNWLRLARERSVSKNAENEVSYLRKHLLKAGAMLSDIGTSEEELAGLAAVGHQ